jgi:hypothetical protein
MAHCFDCEFLVGFAIVQRDRRYIFILTFVEQMNEEATDGLYGLQKVL